MKLGLAGGESDDGFERAIDQILRQPVRMVFDRGIDAGNVRHLGDHEHEVGDGIDDEVIVTKLVFECLIGPAALEIFETQAIIGGTDFGSARLHAGFELRIGLL